MSIDIKKYGYIRVTVVSPKIKLGNVDFNVKEIVKSIDSAVKNKSYFVLFPELSVTGYSCCDLFYQKNLLISALKALTILADKTRETSSTIVVGFPIESKGKLFNAAAFISRGEILGIIPKTFLCNTSEYYEERWFSSEYDRTEDFVTIDGKQIPFGSDLLFEDADFPGLTIGIEICEDLWAIKPVSSELAAGGATLLCNLSASNEYLGKVQYRRKIVEMQSARCLSGYLYSSCGPNESTTDTIFSGHLMYAEYGKIHAESSRFNFDTQILTVDVDIDRIVSERIKNNSFGGSIPDRSFRRIFFKSESLPVSTLLRDIPKNPFIPDDEKSRKEICEEIADLQSNSLIKRMLHVNSKNVVIGVSGGSDSTLALLSITRAFDKLGYPRKNIHAVTMPGFGTGSRTKRNAGALIEALGVSYRCIDISESVNLHFKNICHDPDVHDIVYENSQARERTKILMDIANQVGGLVIGTGDLSELALGWCTYNADQMSMYGLNAGVPKTLVKLVIKWYADEQYKKSSISNILYDILDTPVSPELIPGKDKDTISQESEKLLGPYEVHDLFLYYFVRMSFDVEKIFLLASIAYSDKYSRQKILFWLKIFIKRFFSNQFKRSAMPDGVKIGSVSLSPRSDWRMPSDADPSELLEILDGIRIENK